MEAVRVAFDVGPLSGARTGVGHAVAAMHDALNRRDDVALDDYLLSFRATPAAGTLRLPIPAALAHRLWSRSRRPRVDRWLPRTGGRRVQVVHGTNYVVPPSRLPRLVSVYDCWFLRHPTEAHRDVRRAGEVLRRSVAAGAVVHVSSQATADAVRELLPGADAVVIALGSLPVVAPPPDAPIPELAGRPFVLAIGTIEQRKNLPRLVRAFTGISDANPDVQLVLAGRDGDDRAAVDAAVAAASPQVATRVRITGQVDEPTRSWLLHHARVLAYPSLDEGFGFPLLDAMQVGVPVVASSVGSIPEVAGDAALLGAPDDVDALSGNLATALCDRTVRARLVDAGDRQWRRFTWERCADELAGLYQRMASTSSTNEGASR